MRFDQKTKEELYNLTKDQLILEYELASNLAYYWEDEHSITNDIALKLREQNKQLRSEINELNNELDSLQDELHLNKKLNDEAYELCNRIMNDLEYGLIDRASYRLVVLMDLITSEK